MMKRLAAWLLCLYLFPLLCSGSGLPDAPVVALDFRGGHLTRISEQPTLSIFADGRVLMPQVYGHTRSYRGQLAQAELRELLDFILVDSRFMAYDEEAVASKLRALKPETAALPRVHSADTVIAVNLPGQQKTVRYRDLGRGPLVEETERLLAVRQRLEQIMSIVKLGGREEALAWLDVANEQLHADMPGLAPLTLDRLKSGTIRDDGSLYVQFVRPAAAGEDGINLAISAAADGEVHVGIVRMDR